MAAIKCDGADCPNDATKLAYLGKSGADVRLCDQHFTSFALRGLLRLKGKCVPMIEYEEINGWTACMVEDFLSVSRN